jgi:hypothetical protein
MQEQKFYKLRLYVTGVITITIWSLLVWGHYNGGVPIHHIAANNDMPAISNWWGALLLPLLTWFLLYRIHKRVFSTKREDAGDRRILMDILYRFVGAILFGALIATCFTLGYNDVTGNLVLALLPFAIFLPIYRAECLLGFVLGMTFTFGAVLPTGFGILVSLAGAVLFLFIRPGILYASSKVALLLPVTKHKPQQ